MNMNWETEQVSHVISGKYNKKDYLVWTARAEDILNECDGYIDKARIKISEFMSEYFYEGIPVTEGFYGTILKGALDGVDWDEITDQLIELVGEL